MAQKGNPHTPLVLMETDKEIERYVHSIIKPILDKVPQEKAKNHVLVQPSKNQRTDIKTFRFDKNAYALWKPHNYRLYFDFDKRNFNPAKPRVGGLVVTTKIINSSELFYKNFKGFSIRVKKTQVEVKDNTNKWYRINLFPESEIEPQFKKVLDGKDSAMTNALHYFIQVFGGTSSFRILNRYSENKVMHESAIDKIPDNMLFRNDVAKKVYKEPNVEFNSPTYASNYLRNRAIETIAPELNEGLKEVASSFNTLNTDVLKPLTEQIKLHLEVMQKMGDTMDLIKEALTQDNGSKGIRIRENIENRLRRLENGSKNIPRVPKWLKD